MKRLSPRLRSSGVTKPRRNPRRKCMEPVKELPPLPPQYFDVLPDGVASNIVRFLSEKPKLLQWSNHVPAETVNLLLRCGDHLAGVARETFRSLNFASFFRDEKRGPCAFGGKQEIGHLMVELPTRLAEGVKSLYINAALSTPCTRAISTHCTGLRHLAFYAYHARSFPAINFCSLIRARGGLLESLEIGCHSLNEKVVSTIAKHCGNIKRLNFQLSTCVTSFASIWKSVSTNLEDLVLSTCSFKGYDESMLGLEDLKRECPNIQRLSLDLLGSFLPIAVAETCTFYGPRLRRLDIGFMDIGERALSSIRTSCPNVEISFSEYHHYSTDIAVSLGNFAVGWRAFSSDSPLFNACDRVGRACPNLKIVKILSPHRPVTEADISPLFVQPKPKLAELRAVVCDASSAGAVFKVLSKMVTSLERFSYDGPKMLSLKLLESFLISQRRLKTVSFSSTDHCLQFPWEEVVRSCVANPSVLEINCACRGDCAMSCYVESQLREIRSSVRTKRISICVTPCK